MTVTGETPHWRASHFLVRPSRSITRFALSGHQVFIASYVTSNLTYVNIILPLEMRKWPQ